MLFDSLMQEYFGWNFWVNLSVSKSWHHNSSFLINKIFFKKNFIYLLTSKNKSDIIMLQVKILSRWRGRNVQKRQIQRVFCMLKKRMMPCRFYHPPSLSNKQRFVCVTRLEWGIAESFCVRKWVESR